MERSKEHRVVVPSTEIRRVHRGRTIPQSSFPRSQLPSPRIALAGRSGVRVPGGRGDLFHRAGAEPFNSTITTQSVGKRTTGSQNIIQIDDIPSITLIGSESIIVITLIIDPPVRP